jgi:hypothetical protein
MQNNANINAKAFAGIKLNEYAKYEEYANKYLFKICREICNKICQICNYIFRYAEYVKKETCTLCSNVAYAE